MKSHRPRTLIALAILLPACLALVASTAGAAISRFWAPDIGDAQPYVEGALTWNGENRGIAWTKNPTTSDNVPAPPAAIDPVEHQKFLMDRYRGTSLGPAPADPDVFTSEPLPRKVFVNVTRGFQLALFLEKNPESKAADGPVHKPCTPKSDWGPANQGLYFYAYWLEPRLDVELYADGKLIGGSYGPMGTPVTSQQYYRGTVVQGQGAAEVIPDNYGVCYYQMHSEVPVLEAGTILTLKVVHGVQEYSYAYGFAGDHRSILRIWEYPVEDLIYRYPDLVAPAAAEDAGAGTNSGTSAFVVAPLAAIAGSGAVLAGRRRSRTAAVVLLAVLLSGCLSSGSDGGRPSDAIFSGKVDNSLIALPTDGTGPPQKTGSIYGLVHDDIHAPIPGVHVAIQNRGNFSATDSKGQFQLLGVEPGSLVLRFDHKDYLSYEAPIEVKAGFASRPQVMLFLKNAKDRDARLHNHDYWDGRTEKGLAAGLKLSPVCTDSVQPSCTLAQRFYISPKDGDLNVVYPGTALLEITLAWDATALGSDRLGLQTISPAVALLGQQSVFAPRTTGQTFYVRTTMEMADVGHAEYSGWAFDWFVPPSRAEAWQAWKNDKGSEYNPGDITVTAKIVKGGIVPLEKPHPDLWAGLNVRTIAPGTIKYQMIQYGFQNNLAPPPATCAALCYPFYYTTLSLQAVPWDAKTVKLIVNQTRDTAPQYNLDVYIATNKVPAYARTPAILKGFNKVDPDPGGTWGQRTYTIAVKEGDANFIYQQGSTWQLAYRPSDETLAWADFQRWTQAGSQVPDPAREPPLTFTFYATATRPAPA